LIGVVGEEEEAAAVALVAVGATVGFKDATILPFFRSTMTMEAPADVAQVHLV